MQISDALRLATIRAMPNCVRVDWASGSFFALFERDYQSVSISDVDVESRSPALRCRSSDVDGLGKDVVLTVRKTSVNPEASYRIARFEQDGYGWTVVILRT